jgi:hypothetical protein
MIFKTWREVDEVLANVTGPATTVQRELAKQARIELAANTPQLIAAALLKVALADSLNLRPPRPISSRHEVRLAILRRKSDPTVSPESDEEAEAWVTYLRLLRRREALEQLKLVQGDIVRTKAGELAEVSSIGQDGRVYFKGGRGFGAWPDLISVVAHANDKSKSSADIRQQAANVAARRRSPASWSQAKAQDLSIFLVEESVSVDDIAELESVIEAAENERPIQRFLEANPQLLTSLLGGTFQYCLPQKRLGGEYIPDFVIGEVDSLGVRWVLVEIETPRSGIYLTDGVHLDEKARQGLSQIIEWKDWLSSNISYAQRRRRENGLGLFDIRENAQGLVLVGRRSRMPETKDSMRHHERQSSNIHIHTYDWLVERLYGSVSFQGPTAANPYLFEKLNPHDYDEF